MREDKTRFNRVFVFAIFTILISMINFASRFVVFKNGLTGFSIQENIAGLYNQMSPISKMFMVMQFTVLALLLLFLAYRRRKIDHFDQEIKDISKWKKSQQGTDLDVLYDILKEKKQLKVSTIADSFKVPKEIAMEWAKILESGNLASIHYPGFGEPELILQKSIEEKKVNLVCPPEKIDPTKIKENIVSDISKEKPTQTPSLKPEQKKDTNPLNKVKSKK